MCSLDGRSGTNKGALTQRILWNERRNMRNRGPSQAATLKNENEQAWMDHWSECARATRGLRMPSRRLMARPREIDCEAIGG